MTSCWCTFRSSTRPRSPRWWRSASTKPPIDGRPMTPLDSSPMSASSPAGRTPRRESVRIERVVLGDGQVAAYVGDGGGVVGESAELTQLAGGVAIAAHEVEADEQHGRD